MNTELQTLEPPAPAPRDSALLPRRPVPPKPPSEGGSPTQADRTPHSALKRRTSKIAGLPKKLRDLINERISDGVPYDQIAQELKQASDPPCPCEISARNISDWFSGGYQDWVRHQDALEVLASRFDFALDLAQNSHPDTLAPVKASKG